MLDQMVGGWIAQREMETVMHEFEAAGAAVAPIYDIAQVVADRQFQALGTFIKLPDEDLGSVLLQNVIARLSETPGEVRWPGRRLGQDNELVFGELGHDPDELARLRAEGVI